MSCPFSGGKSEIPAIYRITDDQPERKADIEQQVKEGDVKIEAIGDVPNEDEYSKLCSVMKTITAFYRRGSEAKREQRDAMQGELDKLLVDKDMAEQQERKVRESYYAKHPRAHKVLDNVALELKHLEEVQGDFEKRLAEFARLFEWSKTIVRVCEWLESNLSEYYHRRETLALPPDDKLVPFAQGLAEITFNLKESQDFFAASVDGRLHQFHLVEKEVLEDQLDVVRLFPDNDRRRHWEADLMADLAFVDGLLEQTPTTQKRRQKMLENHVEFFEVLNYHKQKLATFSPEAAAAMENVVYDPIYTWTSQKSGK